MTSDAAFFIVEKIRTAARPADVAAALLRISDVVLLHDGPGISAACYEAGFEHGVHYVASRVAGLCAVRNAEGQLPISVGHLVEHYRFQMALVAEGIEQ